jgi:hypothetical protein
MPGVRLTFAALLMVPLVACGGGAGRKEIEGNNTGGIIPFEMIKPGSDPQNLANAHCAKWGGVARITFSQRESGSDVVFVCDTPAAPPPAPLPTKQGAPAPRPR